MKPPTAVAAAVHDRLPASRTPSDHVMGAALRDPTSIAKEPCFGRFTGAAVLTLLRVGRI